MKRKTKYTYLKVLQGYYGYCGWEDLTCADSKNPDEMKEFRQDIRDYRENEPQYPHRVITRRELND